MESPDLDVVDTSDDDEREFSPPSEYAGCDSTSLPIRNVVADVASPIPITEQGRCPTFEVASRGSSSDDEADGSSPRKRIKIYSSPRQLTVQDSLDTTFRVGSQNVESPSQSQPQPRPLSQSPSLSIPTDHNSLSFSSPFHHPTTPPRTFSHPSHDQFGSAGQNLHVVASSPLTPSSSPTLLAQTPSRSPDPLQLLSQLPQASPSLVSQPNFSPAIPHQAHPPLADLPYVNRYSLRRREARQLNPYAYDKLLYKQQLKSHPDAIVKFKSPRRRPSPSPTDEDGTQDEFVLPFDNLDEDDDYVVVRDKTDRRRERIVQSPDQNTGLQTKHTTERRDQFDQDPIQEREKPEKKRRQQPRTNNGMVYNVHHDRTRITSKHRESNSSRDRTVLVIDSDDSEFRQALDPGWKVEVERWNKRVSPALQPFANPTKSPPAAPRSRPCHRNSPRRQNEIPLPLYFRPEGDPSASVHRHIVIDMNITPFPSGVKFGNSSFIGRGFLHQLISVTTGNAGLLPPIPCDVQGLEIRSTTSAAVFSELLGPLFDRLASALHGFELNDADAMNDWASITCASSQLLSWLAVNAEEQEFIALEVALREYLDGLSIVLKSLETSILSLTAHWFVVELSARLATGIKHRQGSVEKEHFIQSASQLIQRLLVVDLRPAFATIHAAEGDIEVTSMPHRVAELWVCLIHLLPSIEISQETTSGHLLWRLLADLHPESSSTGAEASEDLWRTIFSLCAISQFSVHGLSTSAFRLPAAWELVAIALRKIILTADPEKERRLPQRALKKRDEYVSCVVSRCFLLWNKWGWRIDDGIVMFKSLQEIFRSRNFANLLIEHSSPMGFLENCDLELLSKRDPHDSVFEVFLKLVVQAVYLLDANVELDVKQRSAHVKKLLQMAVPVSPVPFSRSAPPSAHSLSMLVNRFSAMAVAVHLDPTSSNVKFRIGQARRCLNFRDADDHSRVACVYGMMNFAMIARHHKIIGGLEEVLGWLGEMADVLMDEYKEEEIGSARQKHTITLIQLLIGSVRRMVETQSLYRGCSRVEYPDPVLLDGPWVTRVFNPRTNLVIIQQTGVEIRMLVQSFLDARLKALPDVQPLAVRHSAESQESQDEYDKLFLNDEELLAALGDEVEATAIANLRAKEDALCKVLDKSITPAIYRLVCKYFGESEYAKNDTSSIRVTDEWIDCWVGCANVLVQNNYKDWGLYVKLGQQSWEKIIDNQWRRRVGLRFNLTLLRLDPGAYSKMRDDFVAVLLAATVSRKTTIEHEFISVVLSLDGLKHPLLRTAPFDPIPGTKKYEIGRADFEVARGRLLETVIGNAAGCLRARVDAESQAYVELMVVMLSTMRDIYEASPEDNAEYTEFCRGVVNSLSSHAELESHPRMSDALAWGRRELR